MEVRPITLTGKIIRLEPLCEAHVPDLAAIGLDERIWRYMVYGQVQTEGQMHAWVLDLLNRQAMGSDLPFAVIHLESQKAIGATRYLDIRPNDRALEIGGTWYGLDYQGTLVNKEAKYLLMKHAFETLDCVRVQFKTDLRNERSQRAIEQLGATKEGVLRNHMILPDGTIRHSVYYSVIASEWPDVRKKLEEKLMSK